MSEPTTRDPDMIKMPRDQYEFMRDTTIGIARIQDSVQSLQAQVTELKSELGNTKTVVSGITNDRSELKGAWKAIGIIMAIATSISIGLAWLWTNATSIMQKGHP